MKLSHSKLKCCINNPMEYFIKYKLEISPKFEKPALMLGSLIHSGLEKNTENIDDEFEKHSIKKDDEILTKVIISTYLNFKNKIYDEILYDEETNTKVNLVTEYHELTLETALKSYKNFSNSFLGIIDLLLLTDKGFIILDYKTSSQKPDWSTYKDQLYRYIYLLNSNFPDVPIYKIGIINLKKHKIKRISNETDDHYYDRLKNEYLDNRNRDYIDWHIYKPEEIDKTLMDCYMENLSRLGDLAATINEQGLYYINFEELESYGGSVYKDLILETPGAEVLYKIKDPLYNTETQQEETYRDCNSLDVQYKFILTHEDLFINKYIKFENILKTLSTTMDLKNAAKVKQYFKTNYIIDEHLLNIYYQNYLYKNL